MTDSEKFDLILSEIQIIKINTEETKVKHRQSKAKC